MPTHLAIGVFDGVHIGHRAILGATIKGAKTDGGSAGVLTFVPHPTRILRPDSPTLLIFPLEVRVERLKNVGINEVFQQEFTPSFAAQTPEVFVKLLKQDFPVLKEIYVGENFRFGHHQTGDIKTLEALCRPLHIIINVLPPQKYNNEPISSSRIRRALQAGNTSECNAMLGYNYYISAVPQPGKQRGSRIGFPTLNFTWSPELLPRFGVYFVQLTVAGESNTFFGIANYGLNPTFADLISPTLEVHILNDWPSGLSKKRMKIEWLQFIRPEKRFDSVNDLKTQIASDIEMAKKMLR